MRYASLTLRTLSRLVLTSSRGLLSNMSEALWLLERKCSEIQTIVDLELFGFCQLVCVARCNVPSK